MNPRPFAIAGVFASASLLIMSFAARASVEQEPTSRILPEQPLTDAFDQAPCAPGWVPTFGDSNGVIGLPNALVVFDDGSGPALYAGGSLTTAGGVPVNRIAKWDGAEWSSVGVGVTGNFAEVLALQVFDDGSGPALYVGGIFSTAGGAPAGGIARWDGVTWKALGSGVSGSIVPRVEALAVFDDGSGPALYAGGNFTFAGGKPANHIARWDGETWSPLGSGVAGSFETVRSLAVFDDGSGPALYAGGRFTTAGGMPANRIAKWDGSAWWPLGAGMSESNDGLGPYVRALAVFDDGSGLSLFAGGDFLNAGGTTTNRIARWDGAAWSPVANGMDRAVYVLTVFDDGTGPSLYAGGRFTTAGKVGATSIAKWDGAAWSALGSGISGYVGSLAASGDDSGPALYAGGFFSFAGGLPAKSLAKWQGCAASTPCPGDANGDGVINFSDLNTVLTQFGQSVAPGSGGDVTGDGAVNFADLNEVLSNFGNACD